MWTVRWGGPIWNGLSDWVGVGQDWSVGLVR